MPQNNSNMYYVNAKALKWFLGLLLFFAEYRVGFWPHNHVVFNSHSSVDMFKPRDPQNLTQYMNGNQCTQNKVFEVQALSMKSMNVVFFFNVNFVVFLRHIWHVHLMYTNIEWLLKRNRKHVYVEIPGQWDRGWILATRIIEASWVPIIWLETLPHFVSNADVLPPPTSL